MSTFDDLPVVLVSAANEDVATEVINDLIDNEVTQEYKKEAQCLDRVWRLINKYYSADVRVHVLTDQGQMDLPPETVEAHIIHITEDEAGAGAGAWAQRAAAAGGAWRRAHVRVLLLDAAAAPAALAAAAAQAHAHLVPRAERPAPEQEHEQEHEHEREHEHGVPRARAALHAHAWPNLVRRDVRRAAPPPANHGSTESLGSVGSGGSRGSTSSAEERRAVEHAEAFVAALGALGDRAPDSPGPLGLTDPARLDRAEELVAAFCRALGLDPTDL